MDEVLEMLNKKMFDILFISETILYSTNLIIVFCEEIARKVRVVW